MKRIILLTFLITLLMSFVSGCYLLPKEEEPLAPPLVKPVEVEYKTIIIELSDIKKETIVQGKFKPAKEATLSFEERGGYLLVSDTRQGETVKEGDLLFALDIDDMELEQQIAALDLEKATLNYDRIKARTSSSYDRRMAEIDMEIKQIAYDRITVELDKSKIFATMDGVITYMSNANIGDYVEAKKVMVKIADTSELRLVVQGDDALKLSFGDMVTVNLEKKMFQGQVVMSPVDKPENMEESFDQPTAIIDTTGFNTSDVKINQDAKITIVEGSAENVIVIRRSLVNNYYGRNFVYILEDGIKVERDVETGISNNTMVQIKDGLEVGDVLIIN